MANNGDIEHRLAALEDELARLKQTLGNGSAKANWIDRLVGSFKDDPVFDEIVKLGREYRQSQTPDTHG